MVSRAMKDSGVEWIGEIPNHWNVGKLKNFITFINGYAFNSSDLNNGKKGHPVIRIGDFNSNGIKSDITNYAYVDFEKLKNYIIHNKDILIAMSGATVGKIAIAKNINKPYYINQRVGIIRSIISSYIYHYLNSGEFMKYVFLESEGSAQPNISSSDINNFPIPIIPVNEQQKIAAFLDEKVSHIDNIIEDTKKSIENLKVYKQSLITETVTKGLSPDVETKDSGVEWFGRIPSHWKVSKVGNVFEVILGKMLSTFPKESNWTEERYLSAINVHFEGVETFNLKKMWFSPVEKEKLEVKFGDLLVVEGGAGAGGSALYLSEEKGIYVQNSINIVRPKANLSNTSFAYYIFYCLVKNGYVDYVSNKATIPHFTKEKVQSVPYPIIPLNEQQVIVEFLDERTKQVDSLIDQKEQLVIELESYKKSLIYEYVTGKKEVK